MDYFKSLIFSAVLCYSATLNAEFDKSEYHRMPELYKYDDFDRCMDVHKTEAIYCVVNTYIKPDDESNLYMLIKNFSSNWKQHLRHDKLQRGICMNDCRSKLDNLGNSSGEYFVAEFPMDSKIIFDNIKYPKALDHRESYNDLANKCVNLELMSKYDLSGYSSIEYCKSSVDEQPYDSLDLFVVYLLIFIPELAVASTIYDAHLKKSSSKDENHYKTPLPTKYQRVFTIFSLKRNWNTLIAENKPEFRDLSFIDALRTIFLAGVIQNHVTMYSIILPSANPIYIDDTFSTTKTISYMSGNPGMQSFFVFGGFLTAVLFFMRMEKDNSSNFKLFIKGIIGRYVRFAPLLVIMILIHSTWLYRLGGGPFWDRVNYTEMQFCRENWWTNLLFIDNYVNVGEKCLIHSWYLAADFWLRIFATICLIFAFRRPSAMKKIFGAVLGFSVAAISYTIFVNDFEAISIFPPENIRNQLLQASPTEPTYFKTLYIPTHLNLCNYIIGVIAGIYYYNMRKSKKSLEGNMKLRIMFHVTVITLSLNVASNYLFYVFTFKTTMVTALIGGLLKHVWGIAMSIVMIGIIYRHSWFFTDFLNYPVFRITGRISYGTLICHLFVTKLLMAGVPQPIYLNDINVLSYSIAAIVLSNVMGFVLTIFIDLPMATICNMLNLRKGL